MDAQVAARLNSLETSLRAIAQFVIAEAPQDPIELQPGVNLASFDAAQHGMIFGDGTDQNPGLYGYFSSIDSGENKFGGIDSLHGNRQTYDFWKAAKDAGLIEDSAAGLELLKHASNGIAAAHQALGQDEGDRFYAWYQIYNAAHVTFSVPHPS